MMDEIVEFLRKYVNGKTLYTDEMNYYYENRRYKGTYSDQKCLSNMFHSKTRATMDKFVVSKDRVIDTETRKIIKDDYSSTLYRYSFALRQSTGEVTGTMAHIGSSLISDLVPAESTVWVTYGVEFKNNEVKWTEDQMLYRDRIIADGKYRPVAYRARCRLFLTDEGLAYEYVPEFFDVDPKTLIRTPSDGIYPTFVSRERRV